MGDIYVHEKMKQCCAATLGKLDKVRTSGHVASGDASNSAPGSKGGGLQKELSPLTIPKAMAAAQKLHDTGSPLLKVEGPAKAVWTGIVNKHRARHEGAGETMEALFWQVLAEPLPVLDLSVHPDMVAAFDEMAGGKKSFSAFANGGEKEKKFLDKLKDASGGKLDFKDGQLLYELGGSGKGPSVWIGIGKMKLKGSDKAAGGEKTGEGWKGGGGGKAGGVIFKLLF